MVLVVEKGDKRGAIETLVDIDKQESRLQNQSELQIKTENPNFIYLIQWQY